MKKVFAWFISYNWIAPDGSNGMANGIVYLTVDTVTGIEVIESLEQGASNALAKKGMKAKAVILSYYKREPGADMELPIETPTGNTERSLRRIQ